MKRKKSQRFQQVAEVEDAGSFPTGQNQQGSRVIRIVLVVWMISAFLAVFVAYLVTRDSMVVLIWTTVVTLATVAFTYFFSRGE